MIQGEHRLGLWLALARGSDSEHMSRIDSFESLHSSNLRNEFDFEKLGWQCQSGRHQDRVATKGLFDSYASFRTELAAANAVSISVT